MSNFFIIFQNRLKNQVSYIQAVLDDVEKYTEKDFASRAKHHVYEYWRLYVS